MSLPLDSRFKTAAAKPLVLFLLCTLLLVTASAGQSAPLTINVLANIDGRSHLILRANTAQWFHLDFAAPGRHAGQNLPTVINGSQWSPVWPDVPDSQNRGCHCFSDVFDGVFPPLPETDALNVAITELQVRGATSIVELPTAANGFALIIEFNDNPIGSDANYLLQLEIEIETVLITTGALSAIQLGAESSQQLEAVGGNGPYSWSFVDGMLPPGMDLSISGVFSGTPTELGTFIISLKVADANGEEDQRTYTVAVVLAPPSPAVRLSKIGTAPVPGRVLDYFISVENIGIFNTGPMVLTEFPAPDSAFSIEFASPQPAHAFREFLIWEIPGLSPGQIAVLTYRAALSPEFPLGETVIGSACSLCPAALDSTECKLAPSLCEFGGCDPVLGCDTAGMGCLEAVRLCHEFCKELCPEGSAAEDRRETQAPIDPNEKIVIAKSFIRPNQTLVYVIHFENIGDVEARDVFVTDILDPNLDDTMLETMSPGASYDPHTRKLRWELVGRDLQPGETDNVLFSIRPLPGLPSGTEIRNTSEIQFEIFEPLVTPEVLNIIDTTLPTCVMEGLPARVGTEQFVISWSGFDAIGEIESYSVFVSENGGTYGLAVEGPSTSAVFSGAVGTEYGFFCVAKDSVGNVEDQDLLSETTTRVVLNSPPVANAGVDRAVECTSADGAMLILDGTASFDPDEDLLSFSWTGPFGEAAGATPAVRLPLGVHLITLTVDDGNDGVDADEVEISVEDTTPPSILVVTADPNVLWPPNHKMVAVGLSVTAEDVCDGSTRNRIVRVASNEPLDSAGDGSTSTDWQITGLMSTELRAERSGAEQGRIYSVEVECTDASGNAATAAAEVTVPHDGRPLQ